MVPEIKGGISNITEMVCDSLNIIYTTRERDNSDIYIKNRHPEVLESENDSIKRVPSVIGMGLKDALLILEQSGINVSVNGHGCVVEQTPKSGEPFNKGDKVTITLK